MNTFFYNNTIAFSNLHPSLKASLIEEDDDRYDLEGTFGYGYAGEDLSNLSIVEEGDL